MPRVDLSHVTVDMVSVSETVRSSWPGRSGRPGSFRLLVAGCRTRMDVIVHFLALLELCKMGRVALGQGQTFGDLEISWLAPTSWPGCPAAGAWPRWPASKSTTTRMTRDADGEAELGRTIEAILLVAVEPLAPQLLAELLEEPVERVDQAIDRLAQSYQAEGRGFMVARIAGGARLPTQPDLAPYVERFANRESRTGSRPPRWRRWPSWPTASRCRAADLGLRA